MSGTALAAVVVPITGRFETAANKPQEPNQVGAYKSNDQQAFEEALTHHRPHRHLINFKAKDGKGLGFFNAVDLHYYLITGKSQPYLVRNEDIKKALQSFTPECLDEICDGLRDTAFYSALHRAAKEMGNDLPKAYKTAMAIDPYGKILHDELRAEGCEIDIPTLPKLYSKGFYPLGQGALYQSPFVKI